ncbi:MAG TPA: YcaO-like family protein [Candidatus Saccharimonadales bacterium]|nr:YcaO-like family protein [Candidatus Saccharimonadales bacterium]
MDLTDFPLVVMYGFRASAERYTFLGRQGHIDIHEHSDALEKILRLCSGLATLAQVCQASEVEQGLCLQLIDVLEQNGIVIDSRKLYQVFHQDSANPMQFGSGITTTGLESLMNRAEQRGVVSIDGREQVDLPICSNLLAGVDQRITTRAFAGPLPSLQAISNVLASAYGIGKAHCVPSAGGLYPFSLYFVVQAVNQVLSQGVYCYNHRSHSLSYCGMRDRYQVQVALDSLDMSNGAPMVVCLVASMDIVATKYANRGYRYALIEAGHIAQNIQLFCSSEDFGVMEYGGFDDNRLKKLLGLAGVNQMPLLALGVGRVAQGEESLDAVKQAEYQGLTDVLAGKSSLLYGLAPIKVKSDDDLSFYGMVAESASPASSKKPQYAFGSGYTRLDAAIRAMGECFERHIGSQFQQASSTKCKASDLDAPYLSPKDLTPYTPQQIKRLGDISAFDPGAEMVWLPGCQYPTKTKVYIAAENVYYPIRERDLGRKPCHFGDSSGLACHPEASAAVIGGLLELIERDALMVHWYGKKVPPKIPNKDLTHHIRSRLDYWKAKGKTVEVLDLTLDSVPVALVVIYGVGYPYFTAGAAAEFSMEAAIDKGFREAELMLASWSTEAPTSISPKDISSPEDHGAYYFEEVNFSKLEWLMTGEYGASGASQCSAEDLFLRFQPVVVELPHQYPVQLKVVRVLSQFLLPINFGYARELVAHLRFQQLGISWTQPYPAVPHFFS